MPPADALQSLPVRTLLAVLLILTTVVTVPLPRDAGSPGTLGAGTPSAAPASASADVEVAIAAGHGAVPGPALDGLPALRWRVPANPARTTTGGAVRPVVAGGLVWHQTDRLRAYDLATGQPGLDMETDWPFTMREIVVAGDLLLVPVPATTAITRPSVEALDGSTIPGGGRLAGVDAATGQVRWVAGVPVGLNTPVVLGDTAWLTDDDHALLALDLVTGQVRWVVDVTMPAGSLLAPAVADGQVVVSATTGFVAAFDAATGAGRWTGSVGGEPGPRSLTGVLRTEDATPPTVAGGLVAVARVSDAEPAQPTVYTLDAATGEPRWSLPVPTVVSSRMSATSRALIVPFESGVQAVDLSSGNPIWTNRVSPGFVPLDQPVVAGDVIYLGQWYGSVNAIEATSGGWLWHAQTQTIAVRTPYLAGGVAVMTDWEGGLSVLDGGGAAIDQRTVAQPTADETLPIVDISGLPPCGLPAPRSGAPAATPTAGTPVAPLSDDRPTGQRLGEAPAIRAADIPTGTPPDEATIDALRTTAGQMAACARKYPLLETPMTGPQYVTPERYAGFFTARFTRRPWFREVFVGPAGVGWFLLVAPPPVIGDDVRVLADGRIAVISVGTDLFGDDGLYVFVEQDGYWLVDAYLRIGES